LHATQIDFRFAAAGHTVEQLHAKFAQLETRANLLHSAFLLLVEFVSWWRVSGIKGVFGGIERLFPTFEQGVAQHAFDQRAGNLRELQELRQRQRAAFGFEQGANFFFFLGEFFSARSGRAFPGNNGLRFSLLAEQALADFDELAALQALQGCGIDAVLCCQAERGWTVFRIYFFEEGALRRSQAVGDLSAAESFDGVASRWGENDFTLRFEFRQRRKHGAEDFADGSEVVAGDPLGEFDELGGEGRGRLHDFGDLADLGALGCALGPLHHDADQRFLAEGDKDAAAGVDSLAERLRDGVGEGRAEGHGQGHVAKGRTHQRR